MPRTSGLTRLEQAQELVYDAWEAATDTKAIALAEKALKTSPMCADAYGVLALRVDPASDECVELWRKGVEAGKKALGTDWKKNYEGGFWGYLETRPLMRCMHGLAVTLRRRHEHEEAIRLLRELLQLNPNDNQGARYVLAVALLDADRDGELQELVAMYPEEDAGAWKWTLALASFRRHGDSDRSRTDLRNALDANEHVPKYLLGRRKLPRTLPDYISYGEASEAANYVAECSSLWSRTSGVLDWLNSQVPARTRAKQPKPDRARLN